MEVDVYFDESGDLGWTLDKPYRKGGSSQYFTVAYLILPTYKNKHINRFLKRFNKGRGSTNEFKGASFANTRAKQMAIQIVRNVLGRHQDMIIGSVTVRKAGVPTPLINTGNDNVLYNRMVQIGICTQLSQYQKVNIIPDRRSVPAGSQNSCSDLIKNDLWLQQGLTTEINYRPEESHHNERLMFIDWIANFVWRNYENGYPTAYEILGKTMLEDRLFF